MIVQFRRVLRRLGDSCRLGDRTVFSALRQEDHARCVSWFCSGVGREIAQGLAGEVGRVWVRSRRPGQALRFSDEITREKGKCVKLSLGHFLRCSKLGRRTPFIRKPGHLTRPPRPARTMQAGTAGTSSASTLYTVAKHQCNQATLGRGATFSAEHKKMGTRFAIGHFDHLASFCLAMCACNASIVSGGSR